MLAILFFVGLAAGFVDSIAGGGGLITLPVLLGIGLPPHVALATNKFQSSFGSFSAAFSFVKAGQINFREAWWGIIFTLGGAFLGTWAIEQINADFLKGIIPYLLILVVIYTIFTPKIGEEDIKPRMGGLIFFLFFGSLLGFYDGFLGPGTGSFWTIALMIGLGLNMTKATAYTKVMNFVSNIVSLLVFLVGGHIVFQAGLVMAIGQVIGARLGSGLVIEKGTRFIKPIFISMVLLTIGRLIYKNWT